jgi:hypothetical protein
MSSGIWTRSAVVSELRPLRLEAVRAVEAQHQVSTRKLVDTLEEQALLEDLIEGAKPAVRVPAGGAPLHYLLTTPFRYPPLRHGSRFGARHEPGIWYGSETVRTVLAEVAYYRLVFLEGTSAALGTVAVPLTLFRVTVRTRAGADLLAAPFAAEVAALASPVAYRTAQALGGALREAGAAVIRYASARDRSWTARLAAGDELSPPATGVNVAVLAPAAFGRRAPRGFETWHCTANRARVEFAKRDYAGGAAHVFERGEFEVAGALPSPAV